MLHEVRVIPSVRTLGELRVYPHKHSLCAKPYKQTPPRSAYNTELLSAKLTV